jgi:glycosyltransferase involved in cell wall biosynthesis
MVGFMLKKLYGMKWITDFRDPWVDSQVQGDRLGVCRRLDRIWESLVLNNADRVVSVSPTWAKLLKHKLRDSRNAKIHVVYNGYDPDDIPENIANSGNAGLGSPVLHIHYNGTIQGPMLPSLFFKAVAELKRSEPRLHENLECTFTGLPERFSKLRDDLGLKEIVRDLGCLSHRESMRVALRSDVLLLIMNEVDKTSYGQITGKIYEYLATGRHILAIIPPKGDLYDLLKGHEQSHVIDSNSLAHIVETLKLLVTRKRKGELTFRHPPGWISQYSRQAQTRRLAEILNELDDIPMLALAQ